MRGSETPIQPEWTRAAFDAANEVRDLVASIRVHGSVDVDLASNDLAWTVAVPVVVGSGVPVADDAPEAMAVGLALDAVAHSVRIIEPGDRMRIVGGTNGHMGWPPATRVFEVQSGALVGERVQFILEPDPRPAGEAAATAAVALLRADEPVLADPVRLAALHRVVALHLAATDSTAGGVHTNRP
jgi:hypothetical protein